MLTQNKFLTLTLFFYVSADAQISVDTTRQSAYDYACIGGDGQYFSGHQRLDKAAAACLERKLNDPDGVYDIIGGRWRIDVSGSNPVDPPPDPPSEANILWDGGFEGTDNGDFTQWPAPSDENFVDFNSIPSYGTPIQYGSQIQTGDGSLLELVHSTGGTINSINFEQGPTRCGVYASKTTIKTSATGTEPADCDAGICTRRRTELNSQYTLPVFFGEIAYDTERWVSFSVYVPSDWDLTGGGFGINVWQLKPWPSKGRNNILAFKITSGGNWEITHRWNDGIPLDDPYPWQHQMFYAGDYKGLPYPRADFWPEGLVDFPNTINSHAALQSLNLGGWTDWVIHIKLDYKGVAAGGDGYIEIWKREDLGLWVEVLDIRPVDSMNRGGLTFDRGIGYNGPSNIGPDQGIKQGLYMDKGQVWGKAADRVIYHDCTRIGDENATFSDMSPDGSSP